MILSDGNEEFALPKELYDLRGRIVFNELRVTLKNPNDYSIFSDEYLSYCDDVNKQIEKILNNEIDLVNDSLIADANDELRAKIDAARERIAMQVAKNAEALQDAAVDKIPAVVDAAAGVGAAVSGAVESVKNSVAKSEATTPVDTTTQASAAPATPAAEAASAEDAPAKEESDTTKAE